MKHHPDQGAEPPEPSWLTGNDPDKDQERPRVWETFPPTTLEPGVQWWPESEDRLGDFRPDPDKLRPF